MPKSKRAKVRNFNFLAVLLALPRLAWAAFPLAFFLAALAAFIIFSDVRHRVLDSLGYGLIPVALFIVGFSLALRHNYNAWVKRYWRAWLGFGLAGVHRIGHNVHDSHIRRRNEGLILWWPVGAVSGRLTPGPWGVEGRYPHAPDSSAHLPPACGVGLLPRH